MRGVFCSGIFIFFALPVLCQDFSNKSQNILWYDQPAIEWLDALPLGNGRIGAMVFGSVKQERLQLNEESLWAGMPDDPYPPDVQKHYKKFQNLNLEGKYDMAYQYAIDHLATSPTSIRSYEPLGDLYVSFDHQSETEDYSRQLNMENGIHSTAYEINGKKFLRESFISSQYDVLVYRFISIDGEKISSSIRFEREKDISQRVIEDHILEISGQIFDDTTKYDPNDGGSGQHGLHMKFFAHVAIKADNGKNLSQNQELNIENSTAFTLILSTATDYNINILNFDGEIDSHKNSLSKLKTALNIPYDKLRSDHKKHHSEIFNRVSLEIEGNLQDKLPIDKRRELVAKGGQDPGLISLFFQYGRYLLMASSMDRAVLPANLQGIWNKDFWAPWEADYHMNINLQMNYWPADVTNLSESVIPLTDFLVQLSQKGQETAEKFIDSEGWMGHHVTNPFGRTSPSGSTKSSQVANGYCFPLAGAWMSLSLWRHYEYTRDVEYLEEKVYPIIKGATQFILDFLRENEAGELVTSPSYSPENSYIDPSTGKKERNTVAATMDIQIIRDVFNACIQAEETLGINSLTEDIKTATNRLPKLKIGKDGTLQEWYENYEEAEPGHRHISHLYGLYPSNQITSETPEFYEAAEKTIEKRLAKGGGQTGWSRAWIINFFARLREGDKCQEHLYGLIGNQLSTNLFDLHPPGIFQIDGNLGATAGIAEMLLQSHEPGKIQLLPALPVSWKNGTVRGLKARGNFEVDIYWKDGTLEKSQIYSPIGGKVMVCYGTKSEEVILKAGESRQVFDH